MLTDTVNEASRRSLWLRVREFAVPPSMIKTATARRRAGDWAGACAAANVDVDFNLRYEARVRGPDFAARIRADLRHLAPDLLRWHMPRIAPDGLLRPGLTLSLARYKASEQTVRLVARTPPTWADAGQRISLALWDGAGPHPSRRFRLDLHRHLWDVRRTHELPERAGATQEAATGRWPAEAAILLRAEGRPSTDDVVVRVGAGRRLLLSSGEEIKDPGSLPVLPDAATWVLPDLELLRTALIGPEQLHPLVAAALVPDHRPVASGADQAGQPRIVDCRGSRHRIGLVDGVLVPLDHSPEETRREELLAALTGAPVPCLQVIDQAHRRPDCLTGVRERLDHGDIAGALAVVEGLLGPDAPLRSGELRDELEAAAERRITYGLYRAGLVGWNTLPRPQKLSRRRTATSR
jgi:hypothetical protein